MYNIERFISAQENDYDNAYVELQNGEKETHWMWYMFPQVFGVSTSEYGVAYSIESLEEALYFYDNEILRENLKTLVILVMEHANEKTLEDIFGDPDEFKFISCMTLFKYATNDSLFGDAIEAFDKEDCPITLDYLEL